MPQPIAPPVAPRIEHRELHHGITVSDDYFWLREKANPEVARYLKAENEWTEASTESVKPFSDALYKEMLARIKQTDLSVPVRRGGYLYYTRAPRRGSSIPFTAGAKAALLCGKWRGPRRSCSISNELAKGKPYTSLGAFVLSDDQNLLAWTIDYTGFRQYSLQVKDLRSGLTFSDTKDRVTSVAWAADNKTVFVTTEDEITKRSDKLWRHVLGSSDFDSIYDEKDELFDIEIAKTRDKSYLVLEIESTDTAEVLYLRADQPQGAFSALLPREKKHRYYLDHREGLFYILTNKPGGKDFARCHRA